MAANMGGLLLIGAGLPAFLLLVTIGLPGTVGQAEKVIQERGYRVMGWGLAAGIIFGSILIVLAAIAKPLAFIGMLIVGLIMACGLTAVIKCLAARLFNIGTTSARASQWSAGPFSRPFINSNQVSGIKFNETKATTPTLRQFLLASFILEFAMAFPLLGWFVALPVGLLFALGAGCAALWQQWQATAQPALLASKLVSTEDLSTSKTKFSQQLEALEQSVR